MTGAAVQLQTQAKFTLPESLNLSEVAWRSPSGRSQEELLFSLIERAQNPTMVLVSHVSITRVPSLQFFGLFTIHLSPFLQHQSALCRGYI